MRKLFVLSLRGLVWSVFAFVASFALLVAGFGAGLDQQPTIAGALSVLATANFMAQWGFVVCLSLVLFAYTAIKVQKVAKAANETVCKICTPTPTPTPTT